MAIAPAEVARDYAFQDEFPILESGDRMDQKTFHALYEQMPEGFRAELIGGVVFVASPVRRRHRAGSYRVSNWLGEYEKRTPGVEGLGEGTVVLGPEDEPEPDATLTVLPEYGGATREEAGFQVGVPELVIEVSLTSMGIDLHDKKERYQSFGVLEYLVFVARSQDVRWYLNRDGVFADLQAGADGIFRSTVFPGLWLDPKAFWERDLRGLETIIEQGCGTPEHAEFVQKLSQARKRNTG